MPEQAEQQAAAALTLTASPRPFLPVEQRQHVAIRPPTGWSSLQLREAWQYRELLYFFCWRDLKVRYKQTVMGASWALIQPFVMMVVFSIFLGGLAHVASDGKPYPLFVFSGLVFWTFFATVLNTVATSIVGGGGLISKVYFPRLILPVASSLAPMVDLLLALGLLFGIMGWYGVAPSLWALTVPAFVLLGLCTALAVGIWLGALNVRYRDASTLTPFLTQLWLWATPVAYASSIVPAKYRIFIGLNPMGTVVEGARWALVGTPAPSLGMAGASLGVLALLATGGLTYFKKVERTFADIL
jgi:lipopolysaccharide transport system permease protein